MHIIKVIDSIDCEITKKTAELLKPVLSYKKEYYKEINYHMERKEYTVSLLREYNGYYYFPTGMLKKVKQYIGNDCEIFNDDDPLLFSQHKLKINLRTDQQRLVNKALIEQRGVLKAPTGSGKTILAATIISSFDVPALFIVHTKTLIKQTIAAFKETGLKNITEYTGDKKDLTGHIVVATIQSLNNLINNVIDEHWEIIDRFKVVIIDECHHISYISKKIKKEGEKFNTYVNVLNQLLAPVKIGFTATLPTTEESQMALEATIGPLIDEVTIEEGIEKGILAKPKVKLIKIPINYKIKELRTYAQIYRMGIVENVQRNTIIIDTIKPYIETGKTVLILLTTIDHGKFLKEIAKQKGLTPYFLRGSTESEQREEIRKAFIEKEVKLVIATAVWKEGVNIPSLDVIVNAGGGKSEIATLQSIGRGLRTTKDKKEIILIDFFNQDSHHLINHFGNRLCLYMDNGWL